MTLQRWAQYVLIQDFESDSLVGATLWLHIINYWWETEGRVTWRRDLPRYARTLRSPRCPPLGQLVCILSLNTSSYWRTPDLSFNPVCSLFFTRLFQHTFFMNEVLNCKAHSPNIAVQSELIVRHKHLCERSRAQLDPEWWFCIVAWLAVVDNQIKFITIRKHSQKPFYFVLCCFL